MSDQPRPRCDADCTAVFGRSKRKIGQSRPRTKGWLRHLHSGFRRQRKKLHVLGVSAAKSSPVSRFRQEQEKNRTTPPWAQRRSRAAVNSFSPTKTEKAVRVRVFQLSEQRTRKPFSAGAKENRSAVSSDKWVAAGSCAPVFVDKAQNIARSGYFCSTKAHQGAVFGRSTGKMGQLRPWSCRLLRGAAPRFSPTIEESKSAHG